jgi:hypothetical protein
MPQGFRGWALWAFAQALLTGAFKLAYKLVENAMIGWGDEKIATLFGITSPDASTVFDWAVPFVLAAVTLWLFHRYTTHPLKEALAKQSTGDRFSATGVVHGPSRRTWIQRVEPHHIIVLGLAIAAAGVVWQYLQSRQIPRQVVATHFDFGPPLHSDAPRSQAEAAARAAEIRDAKARAEVAARPPLSAYEAELKLRLIDQMLRIVSDTMEPIIANGPGLQTGAWNAFKDPTNHPNYRANLLTYMNAIRDNAKTLDDLRDRNPQYQDIVVATQQMYYNSVYPAVEDFVSTYGRLSQYLKNDVSNDSFEYLMKSPRDKFGTAIQQFTQWRNTVRGQLIELRRKLSP